MVSGLKPFKIKPYIVWTFIIGLLVLVIFSTTRSNYQSHVSLEETTVYAAPMKKIDDSPTETVPTQIPFNSPVESVDTPPNLFPQPLDTMMEYVHDNLALQTLDALRSNAVHMVSLDEADDSMYPASFNDMFSSSEQDGFMEASVDTIYNVNALTPPRLMTDQVA